MMLTYSEWKSLRVQVQPDVCGGEPCIWGVRLTVRQVAERVGDRHLLADYPYLTADDVAHAPRFIAERDRDATAELLEQARVLLWDLIDNHGAELHDLIDDDDALCPEDNTCTCPRAAAANRVLHGWTPPERQ